MLIGRDEEKEEKHVGIPGTRVSLQLSGHVRWPEEANEARGQHSTRHAIRPFRYACRIIQEDYGETAYDCTELSCELYVLISYLFLTKGLLPDFPSSWNDDPSDFEVAAKSVAQKAPFTDKAIKDFIKTWRGRFWTFQDARQANAAHVQADCTASAALSSATVVCATTSQNTTQGQYTAPTASTSNNKRKRASADRHDDVTEEGGK